MYTVPAGTHITRPPICWSSKGVNPQMPVLPAYAGYHSGGAKVSSAPRMDVCSAVVKTYKTEFP